MYLGGIETMGWVLGDFCLDEKYRSLGPALELQRACLEAVAPPFEFCYDFPSRSMMAVYRRLGVQQTGAMVRWAKLLRSERRIEKAVRSKAVARGLGIIVDLVLARRGRKAKESDCDLVLHQGLCGEEFDALDQRMRGCPGLVTARTTEYLNWRYLTHPGAVHEILTARRAGALLGYAIFTQCGEDANIVDLCSVQEPAVILRLLAGVVDLLGQRRAATVSMNAGDWHPWSVMFERAGFRRREASPLVVYGHGGAPPFGSASHIDWYLMQGERDS
jgi:hypothetical protein